MAKKYDITLHSKANKDLAILIDEDLKKESELLQQLIKEVYEANQKVKESHLRRVQNTAEKLDHLNAEIDALNKDIDQKDQETTDEQFNYLLKSKDQIFNALNTVRLFPNDKLIKHPFKTHLELLNVRLNNLLKSHTESQDSFAENMLSPITKQAVKWAEDLLYKTEKTFNDFFINNDNNTSAIQSFLDESTSYKTTIDQMEDTLLTLENKRTHFFFETAEDDFINEKIDKLHDKTVSKINQKITDATNAFKKDLQAINDELATLEAETLDYFKQKFSKQLQSEQKTQESLEDDLKKLRFEIMKAEKEGDDKKINTLIKAYDQKEKQNLSLYQEKVKQLSQQKIKSTQEKLLSQRKKRELDHEDTLFKLKLQLENERIKFKESTALFKLRDDQKSLENDKKVNDQTITALKDFSTHAYTYKKHLFTLIETLETLCIGYTIQAFKDAIDNLKNLVTLNQQTKKIELNLAQSLRHKAFEEQRISITLKHAFNRTANNIKFQQKIQALTLQKIRKQKLSEIDTIRAQEDAKNDLIFQHTHLEIAEKEYELQLIKIQSLYDNEVELTKSQAERLNIGMDVNEAMVKTTVESQILFAKQQIKFAEKEFEARLENIERAKQQELEYAQEKLSKAEQPYLFEKQDLDETKKNKLDDLSYRLALFVEEKDRRKLQEQKDRINLEYTEKITALKEKQDNDNHIKRYKKQIDSALNRADKAKNDAEKLKEKTIQTFEDLLSQSKEKLDVFTGRKDNTLVPYIESESQTTAKSRLDEALSEAKDQRDEKISEPKKRIQELNDLLESLSEKTKINTDDIDAQLEALYQQHINELDGLDTQKTEAIEKLENAIEHANTTFKTAFEHLDKIALSTHHQDLKRTLLKKAKKQQKNLNQHMKKLRTDHQNLHKKHLKQLESKGKALQKIIDPTILAYKRYLKSATATQTEKLKPIQKKLEDQLKEAKIAIETKY